MRGILFVLICCAAGLSAGCATNDNLMKSGGDQDQSFDYHDEWDSVRKEGRGSEATEKEWDSWTPKLMSPKAMAIERNLGLGY